MKTTSCARCGSDKHVTPPLDDPRQRCAPTTVAAPVNAYESAGREKKVRRFTEAIDRQATLQKRNFTWKEIADFLEGLDGTKRDLFAKSIGEHPPSPKTWAAIVAVYRERAAQPMERAIAAVEALVGTGGAAHASANDAPEAEGFGDGRNLSASEDLRAEALRRSDAVLASGDQSKWHPGGGR